MVHLIRRMPSPGRCAVSAVLLLLIAFLCLPGEVNAQDEPLWCTPDQHPLSGPYPAPTWSQIQAPNYDDVMTNFRIAQSLRLLVSALEKGLAELGNAKSLAAAPDVDGVCLCNCGRDAASWADFLATTVKTEVADTLEEVQDQYLEDIQKEIEAARKTVVEAIPTFEKDLEKIVEDVCNKTPNCDKDAAKTLGKQLAGVAQKEVEAIFQGELDAFETILTGPGGARERLQKLRQRVKDLDQIASGTGPQPAAVLQALFTEIGAILDELQSIVRDSVAKARDMAATYTTADLDTWGKRIVQAVETELDKIFQSNQTAIQMARQQIEAKARERIQAIKTSAQSVYDTATDLDTPLDRFKQGVKDGVLEDLKSVDGCYGTTKRDECTPDDFCEGGEGELFGQPLPMWFPTGAFRDGKTALLWTLETVDWLEKVQKLLADSAPPKLMAGGAKLIDVLKNGEKLLADLSRYVDTFTTGYHLGAYSGIRPDLHMCVGYAGHGALAQLVAFDIADKHIRGGASYLSANLVAKHRVQFRSGGFALNINGTTLPLAPGVSLDLQADGFRFWDRYHPFGLGGDDPDDPNWKFDPATADKYDVFNLVTPEQLTAQCCQNKPKTDPEDCILCPITKSSLLYTPFYPIDYTVGQEKRTWPRPGVEWEKTTPVTAVLGAGLNLDLQSKKYRWQTAPIPIVPGLSLTPWMALQAGARWTYEANHLREMLLDSINKGLPAGEKLKENAFDRDQHAFQAPDVTEDVGHGANVNPEVGADLLAGINLGSRLKIGVTASLYVGADVAAAGFGGVLDLNRSLVETLADSNPEGNRCEPVIDDNASSVCSNTFAQRPGPCDEEDDEDENEVEEVIGTVDGNNNCIDLSPEAPADRIYSTGTYSCKGDGGIACEQRGFCKGRDGKIVLHDITRETCEGRGTPAAGRCVAVYRDNPSGGGSAVARPESAVDLTPPYGVPFESQQAEKARAQALADPLTTEAACHSAGWCFNWVYTPEAEPFKYVSGFTGVGANREACPPARYADGRIINQRSTGQPMPSQFLLFQWQPAAGSSSPPVAVGSFFPYQCVSSVRPKVTGYKGVDCPPMEYGYPSACPEGASFSCACDPLGAPSCPSGRSCVDGACLETCSSTCAAGYTCEGGGCILENRVPFAEQIAWRLKNVKAPQHVVASYAYDKLVTSVVVGIGVKVGLEYKLFRQWKQKTLGDFKKSFPLLTKPLAKHQLGLEARYQDDCFDPALGLLTNHQPDLVKRPPSDLQTSADLVAWCKPKMAGDVENPAAPGEIEDVIHAGLDDTFQFGLDLGEDSWRRGQLCVGGVPWDRYLKGLENDPALAWPLLGCAYTHNGVRRHLDCSSSAALHDSLLTVLGCLNVSGPDALLDNTLLAALLQSEGTASQWLLPGSSPPALDVSKVLIDDEAENLFVPSNVDPYLLAHNGKSPQGSPLAFSAGRWLDALNRCINDAPGGRFQDSQLEMDFDLDADSFQSCGGACCADGDCTDVASQADCGGSFSPGTSCGDVDTISCLAAPSTQSPGGACFVLGQCQEVLSEKQCLGSPFFAGAKCSDLPPLCARDADCQAGSWCRRLHPDTAGRCVPFADEDGPCGGFSRESERCAPGLVCVIDDPEVPDLGGTCRRSCAPLPRNQVAWWPFDESSGPTASDVLMLHNGRHVAGPVPVPGMVQRALRFDGVDDHVQIPDAPELDFGKGDFSIVTWIQAPAQPGTLSILDKRRSGAGYHLYLWRGHPGLQLADGRYKNFTAAPVIADGQWHHLAVTVDRDSTDGIRWYLDGEPVGSPADPTGQPGSLNNSSPLELAVRSVAPNGWWKGALDELMLFDRSLDAAELKAIFTAGPLGQCKPPRAGIGFYTIPPCRVVDTRTTVAPLLDGIQRTIVIGSLCNISPAAGAVSLNVTAVSPTGAGHVVLWPADRATTPTGTVSFGAGQTRMSSAVLGLAADGTLAAKASVAGGGSVDLTIDVNGYFVTTPAPDTCEADQDCPLGSVCETTVLGDCDNPSRQCVEGCREGQRGCTGDLSCVDQICKTCPCPDLCTPPE